MISNRSNKNNFLSLTWEKLRYLFCILCLISYKFSKQYQPVRALHTTSEKKRFPLTAKRIFRFNGILIDYIGLSISDPR